MRVSFETLVKMFVENGFNKKNAIDLAHDCCRSYYDFEERDEYEVPVMEAIQKVFALVGMDIPDGMQQWCLVAI